VYKTVTDGNELFTMQPNFGAKMVEDKTRQDIFPKLWVAYYKGLK